MPLAACLPVGRQKCMYAVQEPSSFRVKSVCSLVSSMSQRSICLARKQWVAHLSEGAFTFWFTGIFKTFYKGRPCLYRSILTIKYVYPSDLLVTSDVIEMTVNTVVYYYCVYIIFIATDTLLFMVRNFCQSNLPRENGTLWFLTLYSFILGKTILRSSKLEKLEI